MRYLISIIVAFFILFIGACEPLLATFSCDDTVQAAPSEDYMLPSDRIVDIDGAKARIRIEGNKGAPTIILLHGFSFSLESWDGWAAELKQHYRVIRYDLLGHGLTGPDPKSRYSPIERAGFLEKVMDTLSIQNAIIGGNSLGGLIAWRFAVKHPNRVKALVLVAPGGYSINGVTETPVEAPAAVKAYFKHPTDLGVQYTLNQLYADPKLVTSQRVQLAKDMITIKSNGQEFIKSIAEFTLPEPSNDLAKIKVPTLLLWGKKDRIIPIDHANKFAANIKNSQFIKYDNAGHIPHEELTAATVKDVEVFIKNIGKYLN